MSTLIRKMSVRRLRRIAGSLSTTSSYKTLGYVSRAARMLQAEEEVAEVLLDQPILDEHAQFDQLGHHLGHSQSVRELLTAKVKCTEEDLLLAQHELAEAVFRGWSAEEWKWAELIGRLARARGDAATAKQYEKRALLAQSRCQYTSRGWILQKLKRYAESR